MSPEKRRAVLVCTPVAILLCSLAFSAVKASRAPITYDEAYTYLRFAQQHSRDILRDYSFPNNHMVHTLMVRASTRHFGNGLVAIRFPAMLGGALFFAALAVIGRRMSPGVNCLWLTLVALTPTIMDYNSLARGYSLGSGLCFAAMALVLAEICQGGSPARSPTSRSAARMLGAGALLGSAIGCVPVFGVLAVAISAAFLVVVAQPLSLHSIRRAVTRLLMLTGGAALIALGIYSEVRLHPGRWPWGYDSAAELLRQFWINAYHLLDTFGRSTALAAGALVVLLAVMGLVAARKCGHRAATFMLLAFVFSIGTLAAARAILGTLWPFPRTLHFMLPLALFAIVYTPMTLLGRRHRKSAMAYGVLLVGLAGGMAASSWDPLVYREWQHAAGVEQALQAVDTCRSGRSFVTVSIPWQLDVCVEYALLRRPRPGLLITAEGAADFRIALAPTDAANGSGEPIFADPRSGLVVLRAVGASPSVPGEERF